MGISANANSDVTADIYNVKIKNVRLAYNTNYYGLNTFFITNSMESNYTTLYSVPNNKEGEIRRYELLDVCVTDDWGDPVSGATVTISVDNPDGADLCSINRLLEELMQTTTLSNGHTPLPCEDQAATIALLRFLKTDTFEQSGFSYSISVEKGAMNAEAADIMPNSAWYRIDPDTYKNTVLITLARIEGDTDVDGDVDGSDLAVLAQNWLSTGGWHQGDFNDDYFVDGSDLALLAQNFGW